ncbi:hypothetical protein SISNIDRAFT_448414 [Sistotremastrum niveocremeum HHB9708]|uniref:Uncharacterized protein n=2 Tax=Sistotremastraceae TaxID=3402574 RepID=A0A164ZYA8_9AGAM|nr:hypothetical protein SISNIDRAFT_448414 [Sistotremastrum niveocremeum HHB9708]KZT40551.1 hypothetical protein SISSUDRAFT_1044069 [Sistotremastrum suecicum HHB10207 ss-3]
MISAWALSALLLCHQTTAVLFRLQLAIVLAFRRLAAIRLYQKRYKGRRESVLLSSRLTVETHAGICMLALSPSRVEGGV